MFILAAALIVAGVALFVAAPLGVGLLGARARSAGELQVDRYEHERALAVQGLRELEFDREMGKLSDADYDPMHKALEERALTAMAAVEKIRDTAANAKKPTVTPLTQAIRRSAPAHRRIDPIPTLVLHNEPARPPQAPASQPPAASGKIRFCPECGTRAAIDSKFCAQCGIAIKPMGAAIARTE
jgi:cytochrome c-type biogenesis protein CcmI